MSGFTDFEISFEQILKEKDEVLSGRIKAIKKEIQPSLGYWSRTHPQFTPHGFPHSQEVMEIIDCLVPDKDKEEFNAYEIFFLIIGAWLHDWGMSDEIEVSSDENRPIHHERSQMLILNLNKELGIKDQEAEIIADLSAGHRIRSLDECTNPKCRGIGMGVILSHHWNYSREYWLDVIWLCSSCHHSLHVLEKKNLIKYNRINRQLIKINRELRRELNVLKQKCLKIWLNFPERVSEISD